MAVLERTLLIRLDSNSETHLPLLPRAGLIIVHH